ncbi:MAG: PRC-barrel domain-containing protein [Candidatus Uhrbacteria bacterium]|nr:PRC-barrel domain-containing protein [Candidatus Uhrbacteria bacterium]
MACNTKDMIGIPVETRSGERIGKVASFDLDDATGRLISIRVKSRGLVSGLMANELIVSWDAVIELTSSKVVIADGAVKIGATSVGQPVWTSIGKA